MISNGSGSNMLVDNTPLLSATTLQLNFALAASQAGWAEKDFVAYCNVRPIDYIFGLGLGKTEEEFPLIKTMEHHNFVKKVLDLPDIRNLRGWSLDGVSQLVEGEEGGAPNRTDGLRMQSFSRMTPGGVTKEYNPTTAARGHVEVINLWDDNGGLMEGARLGFIFKKCAPEQYLRNSDGALVYNMTHKPHDGGRDAHSMTRTIPFRSTEDDYADTLLCPIQAVPVCISDGGPCPRDWLAHYDELGRYHNDGIFVELGRVHANPIKMRFRAAVDGDKQRPLMDGRTTMSIYRVNTILNVDDGLRCLGM